MQPAFVMGVEISLLRDGKNTDWGFWGQAAAEGIIWNQEGGINMLMEKNARW